MAPAKAAAGAAHVSVAPESVIAGEVIVQAADAVTVHVGAVAVMAAVPFKASAVSALTVVCIPDSINAAFESIVAAAVAFVPIVILMNLPLDF